MFDFGFWELILCGVITLIVVGPERMPVIARKVGRYVGKAKQFVAKVQADIDAEVDSTEIKKHLSDMDEDAPILEVFNDNKKILNDIKNDVETQQKS